MKLSEIRALCEAATPGPWTYSRESYATRDKDGLIAAISSLPRNGELIAASRTLMPRFAEFATAFDAFMASFANHYHGFPGKLEWPEIHALKRAREALEQE